MNGSIEGGVIQNDMTLRLALLSLASTLLIGCSTFSPSLNDVDAITGKVNNFKPKQAAIRQSVLADKVIYSFGNYATGVGRTRTSANMHRRIIVRGRSYHGSARQAVINFLPRLTKANVPRFAGGTIYIEMIDSEHASVVALLSKPNAIVSFLDQSNRGSVRGEIIVVEENRVFKR